MPVPFSFRDRNKSFSLNNLCSTLSITQKEEAEKHWKKNKRISNSTTKSTISLHIAAYENSNQSDTVKICEKTEGSKEAKQTFIGSNIVFQNPFEFPRQQENNKNLNTEVSKFKASQKLRNPNASRSSKNVQHGKINPTNRVNPLSTNNIGHESKKDITSMMATTSITDRFKSAIDAIGNKNIVSHAQERIGNLGLRVDHVGNLQGFSDYMHAKQNKLNHQVHSNVVKKSDIFKGISFFVDGLTHPPANDIRQMVTEHGGEYHHYYKNGLTTYFVAEELASTKVDKVRKEQRIIKPTFITDSIKAGKVLNAAEYYLLNKTESGNHVVQFFDRSRLHLISTMAKELKKFVAELKENKANHRFTGRSKLAHLKSSVKITSPIICHIDMDCFFVSVALRNPISCDELYFDLGSICDECDISDPLALITIIRNDIFEQTKCIASAGLGKNALIARMATSKAKPNGQYYVTPEESQNFIGNAPISDLPTVGWTTSENIRQQFGPDIKICKQLFDYSIEDLRQVLGTANGEKVYHALRGKCEPLDFDNIVIDQKTVSVNVNFGIRFKNEKDMKDTLKSISTELSQRLLNINKTGTSLVLKLLIREPDAPLEPAKYGAHGPCFPLRKTITVSQTSDPEIIFNAAMKMIKLLDPVITDIRGVALHMSKLFSVNSVTTKKPGSLWDFMKTKNVTTTTTTANTANGEGKAVLGAFEWVPKIPKASSKKQPKKKQKEDDDDYYSPEKEQNHMRMRISEVCQILPCPPSPLPTTTTRKCVKYPTPAPTTATDSKVYFIHKSVYRQITRNKISIDGIEVLFNEPPKPQHFPRLLTNFKGYIQRFDLIPLTNMFNHLKRFVTNEKAAAKEEWKPLIDSMKKYLNWYCFNKHNSKVFIFEEGPNDDKEFSKFVKDMIREIYPKKIRRKIKKVPTCEHRALSPDLFEEEEENGTNISKDIPSKSGPSTSKADNSSKTTTTKSNTPDLNKTIVILSQESNECEILNEPGPSTSKVNNTSKDGTNMSKDILSKSGPSTSKADNSTKITTTKSNSNTINPGPSTSSKLLTTVVQKPVATISKPPQPPAATLKLPSIPPRPRSAAATSSKQKPSTSKAKKPLPKPAMKKQTSFNIGEKRKQPALEDLWNKAPINKKKRVSLPSRSTGSDDDCIIEDDLNQSVIALN
uniref:DNA repair protein REV1 n=2 Tax=Panagrolaimus sp. PS1159 TaxID=55785 RepID=A0AC35FPC8_9BILA